jgi:hypothetical protein
MELFEPLYIVADYGVARPLAAQMTLWNFGLAQNPRF